MKWYILTVNLLLLNISGKKDKMNALSGYFTMNKIFLYIGLFGQLCFSMRFIIQWIYSEKAKKSVIPVAFWYFSLSGGIILLVYAVYHRDPVFIMGQAPGVFIYSRNIYLIHKNKKEEVSQNEGAKIEQVHSNSEYRLQKMTEEIELN